jgi:hypothetical protein
VQETNSAEATSFIPKRFSSLKKGLVEVSPRMSTVFSVMVNWTLKTKKALEF